MFLISIVGLITVVSNHCTGLPDWNTGMNYWTNIFLILHIFKGGVTVYLGDL